jgi:hypothetical protein
MELHSILYQNKVMAAEEEAASGNRMAERERVRARIASVNKDIVTLLRTGSTPCQISHILGVHLDVVKSQVAEIEREQKEYSDFRIMTGEPSQGGHFAILQS